MNKILMSVQPFFYTGGINRELQWILAEYKRSTEPGVGIQTGLGHTLIRFKKICKGRGAFIESK